MLLSGLPGEAHSDSPFGHITVAAGRGAFPTTGSRCWMAPTLSIFQRWALKQEMPVSIWNGSQRPKPPTDSSSAEVAFSQTPHDLVDSQATVSPEEACKDVTGSPHSNSPGSC